MCNKILYSCLTDNAAGQASLKDSGNGSNCTQINYLCNSAPLFHLSQQVPAYLQK